MKTVIVLLSLLSSLQFSYGASLRHELSLQRPPVKDPISCRVVLNIEKAVAQSCYFKEIFVGSYEDCDFFYSIPGIDIDGGGTKLISEADSLRLLKISALPKECI